MRVDAMSADADEGCVTTRWGVIGFVALAILLGPVAAYVAAPFAAAVRWQGLVGGGVTSALAGCSLLMVGVVRRERMPHARQWLAVSVLLIPRGLDLLVGVERLRPWMYETRSGVMLLIAVAAPLWLGLLAAVGAVRMEVPRAAVAAGIAGVGAVLLVMPTDAYAISVDQIAMVVVRLLIGVITVFAWWFARQRLVSAVVMPVAGLFLLMSAGVSGVASMLTERGAWQAVDWRAAAGPVLVQAGLVGVTCWLWFYLLMRMRLTAFCMHPLAVWTAAIVGELAVVRFALWMVDAAVAIALGAIAIGLRARVAEEQPTVLGLRDA
jgi:hypothetical protein